MNGICALFKGSRNKSEHYALKTDAPIKTIEASHVTVKTKYSMEKRIIASKVTSSSTLKVATSTCINMRIFRHVNKNSTIHYGSNFKHK